MNKAYSVKEAVAAIGISRTKLYDEMRAKRLSARKIGKRRVILADEIARYLASLPVAA